MNRLAEITASAASIVLVALLSLPGVAVAEGGQIQGANSNGKAGLSLDPVDPAYVRLNEDPADADGGQVAFGEPAADAPGPEAQVQVVGANQ
jgi:hypothetical protein